MSANLDVLGDVDKYRQIELLLRGLREMVRIEDTGSTRKARAQEIEDLLDIVEIAEAINDQEAGEIALQNLLDPLRELHRKMAERYRDDARKAVGSDRQLNEDEVVKELDKGKEILVENLIREMVSLDLLGTGITNILDVSRLDRDKLAGIVSRFLNGEDYL